MSTEQLPDGLQLAVNTMLALGCGESSDAIRDEHQQRVTQQHHACDLAQRVADLEAERTNTAEHVASIARQLGDESLQVDDIAVRVLGLVAERDELRKELDCAEEAADVAACSLVSEDGAGYECVGSYIRAVTQQLVKERDALRARLAEIESQEPVAISKAGNLFWAGDPQDWRGVDCQLHARPITAQAAPDADAERYRWLKTRPVEVPTDGPDLALWSDSCGDALRGDAADAAIDDAMATGLGHKA